MLSTRVDARAFVHVTRLREVALRGAIAHMLLAHPAALMSALQWLLLRSTQPRVMRLLARRADALQARFKNSVEHAVGTFVLGSGVFVLAG